MKNLSSFLILTLLMTTSAWAQKKVAVVKLLKGDVDVLMMGKTLKLKAEDWVEEGSVVKTGEKSFVKLVFIDKSQMNIGPSSEMKIEKFGDKDSGVIDLVKGKIRSQVTKDYLQMNRDKSKLFIKTPNAVMGVRGTDFLISTNGQSTSTVLFEGAISFNKLENRGETNTDRLEDVVDRGVNIKPGEFSVADQVHPLPTVPSVLNVNQREALEKNVNFETTRAPGNSSASTSERSIVPPGLSGQTVSNNLSTLKTEIANIVPAESPKTGDAQGSKTENANFAAGERTDTGDAKGSKTENGKLAASEQQKTGKVEGSKTENGKLAAAEQQKTGKVEGSKTENGKLAAAEPQKTGNAQGFVSGDSVKPTNGSFLHLDSGVIIAPPPGSVFDPNTNSYIPTGTSGAVSTSGDYVPPKNVEITNDGKIFVASVDPNSGKTVVNQALPPPPVTREAPSLGSGPVASFGPPPKDMPINDNSKPSGPRSNDILGTALAPTVLVVNQNNTSGPTTTSRDERNTNVSESKQTSSVTINTGN